MDRVGCVGAKKGLREKSRTIRRIRRPRTEAQLRVLASIAIDNPGEGPLLGPSRACWDWDGAVLGGDKGASLSLHGNHAPTVCPSAPYGLSSLRASVRCTEMGRNDSASCGKGHVPPSSARSRETELCMPRPVLADRMLLVVELLELTESAKECSAPMDRVNERAAWTFWPAASAGRPRRAGRSTAVWASGPRARSAPWPGTPASRGAASADE